MQAAGHGDDVRAIERLIARQFGSLTWTPETSADWDAFAADFFRRRHSTPLRARLSARALRPLSSERRAWQEQSCARSMRPFWGQRSGSSATLRSRWRPARWPRTMGQVSRGVEMLLLIKDASAWQIVSQAWDMGSPSKPIPNAIPNDLLGGGWRVLEARLFDVSMEWVRQRTDREERPNYSPWARSALRQKAQPQRSNIGSALE